MKRAIGIAALVLLFTLAACTPDTTVLKYDLVSCVAGERGREIPVNEMVCTGPVNDDDEIEVLSIRDLYERGWRLAGTFRMPANKPGTPVIIVYFDRPRR